VSRAEWSWLAGAIVLGLVLRLGFPSRMAIEHFDEGVYASNFWFDDGAYPARHLYAPPLLPMAIEWTMIAASLCGIRPTGFIPIIPSLVAGLATIPSIWWIGRRWFGSTAGIAAAWLVAGSDFHASYSRAALTDIPLCLFLLWAVYFIWRGLQTGARRDLLLAGLFTGLAWWTKYNGWLPLAIGLTGGTAWQLFSLRTVRQMATTWKRWGLISVAAFLVWSPVLIGLQTHGGYRSVAANHAQYITGFRGWGDAALRQMEHVGIYDDWCGLTYEVLLEVVARKTRIDADDNVFIQTPTRAVDLLDNVKQRQLRINGLLLGKLHRHEDMLLNMPALPFVLVLASPVILAIVSIIALPRWILTLRPNSNSLSGWLLAAWFGGLTVATPFYHPYPRLILPWLIAAWLAVGVSIQLLVDSGRFGTMPPGASQKWRPSWCDMVVPGWLILFTVVRCWIGNEHCWQDRSSLARAAANLAIEIRKQTDSAGHPGDEAIVYVAGNPALVYALKANGLPLVGPVQDLDSVPRTHPRPTYVIRWSPNDRFDAVTFGHSHLVCFDKFADFTAVNDESGTPYGFTITRVR
jgi:4-amino-4-deoxy-L-arabinose transferase-like glycosyltransferase